MEKQLNRNLLILSFPVVSFFLLLWFSFSSEEVVLNLPKVQPFKIVPHIVLTLNNKIILVAIP